MVITVVILCETAAGAAKDFKNVDEGVCYDSG
jgi:hypothetical protein